MKDIVNKVITNPSFFGGVFGAIAGGYTGMIIAGETGKPFKRLILEGAGIGVVIGSSYASASSLNNKKQIIDYLKLQRNQELIDNLFA